MNAFLGNTPPSPAPLRVGEALDSWAGLDKGTDTLGESLHWTRLRV